MPEKRENSTNERLIVLWTSGDREVAIKMTFMYTLNAKRKGWWKEVTLIVWGPSSKLLVGDKELRDYIAAMQEAGIVVEACVTCADMYGVTESLKELGIDVKSMGVPLTDYLKEGHKIITT